MEMVMHHAGLIDVLWFLLASVITVPIFRRFGLSAVLGYLFVGLMLGPFGFKIIDDPESTLAISELGVVMMLFVIGLELSPPRLWQMRHRIFGAGSVQVVLSSAALVAVLLLLGLEWKGAVVLAIALALSSTAVVLQLLVERKQLGTPHGKSAFGILLFQDIVAIPLLAAIPLLGQAQSNAEGLTGTMALKAVGVVLLVIFVGRYVMRQLFRAVAWTQMREIFTATALLIVIGTGWLMSVVGLSMGLGAFLAGVLMADSEFRHEVEAQVDPFKGLLLGLFFISVGMTINLPTIYASPAFIFFGVLILLLIKSLVLYCIGIWQCKIAKREALLLAGTMALGGEFAFVVFADSVKFGLMSPEWRDRLVAIVGISIALTPLIIIALQALFNKNPQKTDAPVYDTIDEGHPRVVIAGFGRVGQIVGRMLRARKIPFIALENSVEQVAMSRKFGNLIYFGDPSRLEVLQSAHIAQAELLVIAADDPEINLKIARLAKRHFPHLRVIARARNRQHAFRLMDLGVPAIRESFHSSIELGKLAFIGLGYKQERAEEFAQLFTTHDESILAEQYLVHDNEAALIASATQAFMDLEKLFDADQEDKDLTNQA
jgi:glutathione-regulated potassium-efflux system protein KefB